MNEAFDRDAIFFGGATGWDLQYKFTPNGGSADIIVQHIFDDFRVYGKNGMNCDTNHRTEAGFGEFYEMFNLPGYDTHTLAHGCGTWTIDWRFSTVFAFDRAALQNAIGTTLPSISTFEGDDTGVVLDAILTPEQLGKLEDAIRAFACPAANVALAYDVDLCAPTSYDIGTSIWDADGLKQEDYFQ